MVAGLRVHRTNQGQLISDTGDVRKELRDPKPAASTGLELPVIPANSPHLPEENLGPLSRRCLAVKLLERRLVVEGVNLAEPSHQADIDGPLRLRLKARQGGTAFFCLQHAAQRRGAETVDSPIEKAPAGNGFWLTGFHCCFIQSG